MKEEKGAVMVEAAFIFPMVVLTVMALIYLGLFKLQESAMLYQVQQIAKRGSYVVASPGYQKLGEWDVKKIDFAQEPSGAQIKAYYKAYHTRLSVLYRELFGCTWSGEGELDARAAVLADKIYIFTGNSIQSHVKLDRNFLSYSITVTTTIKYPMPGVLRYFGFDGELTLLQGASSVAVNPADFIRDVDLACDAVKGVCKALGMDGQLNEITANFKKMVNKFL